MGLRISTTVLSLAILAGPIARSSSAQVTLADDIILAAQGKENAERNRRTNLGRAPGSQVSPYRRSPGSSEVLLGVDPTRRLAPLRRQAQRPANVAEILAPGRAVLGHRSTPVIESPGLPPELGSTGIPEPSALSRDSLDHDDGPPAGLTLDAAIERLVRFNPELRSKSLEIPQAQADVLTAGLRENPLFFYSSDSIPYGSYSQKRPGEIDHGISLVFPMDYSGKRRARITLAEREKCVLEAQYRDAVRLAIDELGTAYVDALAQRYAARSAERELEVLNQLRAQARAKLQRGDADEEAIDDLTIECELAAISRDGEQVRYQRAKQRLVILLDLSPSEAAALDLRGSLRKLGPQAPPVNVLIDIALGQRPDLSAFRLGVWRAQAEFSQERAERFSDAYLLYTPFEYRDNSQVGLNSVTAWGAGLFVSLPLFNRNQGNLKRARINIDQSRIEASSREQQVIAEVRQAVREFKNSYADGKRLDQVALPALRRKRERAGRKFRLGEIDTNQFLGVQRDSTSLMRYYRETLARHRRDALKLNTAVGHRVLP